MTRAMVRAAWGAAEPEDPERATYLCDGCRVDLRFQDDLLTRIP